MSTICTIVALAIAKGWVLHQIDVKDAFLHGDLQEEVYMAQSQGYKDPRHLDYVCKLRKALYGGLKQAPLAWHERIAHYLVIMGFCMADANHSLYVQKIDSKIVFICI